MVYGVGDCQEAAGHQAGESPACDARGGRQGLVLLVVVPSSSVIGTVPGISSSDTFTIATTTNYYHTSERVDRHGPCSLTRIPESA